MIGKFIQKKRSSVGNVILDATLSETHTNTNQVTDHPVEDGSIISDHINRQPDTLDLVGTVSDFPVYWLGGTMAPSPIDGDATRPKDRVALAYGELRRIMIEGELITVVTTLREYENMAIISLTVSRDAGTGKSLPVTISLREIILVETKEVAIPEPESIANKKLKDKGRQATKTAKKSVSDKATSTTENTSILWEAAKTGG